MYRDLSCHHHLVQERYDERPDIPGLTPVGFERWVTLLIQAHPEEEFERLQKAVLEMPISNPDNKKERFPKEISRRLFPGHGDTSIRDRIEDSISEHAAVDLPRRSSRDEPRNHQDSPPQKSAPTVDPTPTPQNHRASVSFNLSSTTTNSESAYVPSISNANVNLTPTYPLRAPSMIQILPCLCHHQLQPLSNANGSPTA